MNAETLAPGRRQALAYGLLGLPLAFAALPIYVHVPQFYAETLALPLASIGAILLATRLLDAVLDPWLGRLADRWPRRTMALLALVPFAAGFLALFNPPAGAGLVWLAGALAVTYLGFSAAQIAYQAWGAQVGGHPQGRTRLTAAREGFGLVGVLAAAALPGLLAEDSQAGLAAMSWLLLPLLLLAAWSSLRPVPVAAGPEQPAAAATVGLRQVLGDRDFRRLLAVFVANGIAAALPATLFLFFVADVLEAETATGPLLALYFVAGALSLPLWVPLAARLGRPRAWLMAMALAVGSFAWAGFLEAGDLWPFAAVCLLSGIALGADLTLPAAMAADLGQRSGHAGACFGVWNLAAKANLALAAGLALPLLAWFGYQPGGASGLAALATAYGLLPILFKLMAAALLWRWRHSLEDAS
jgi:Na+/melibiose symporter-like transporter